MNCVTVFLRLNNLIYEIRIRLRLIDSVPWLKRLQICKVLNGEAHGKCSENSKTILLLLLFPLPIDTLLIKTLDGRIQVSFLIFVHVLYLQPACALFNSPFRERISHKVESVLALSKIGLGVLEWPKEHWTSQEWLKTWNLDLTSSIDRKHWQPDFVQLPFYRISLCFPHFSHIHTLNFSVCDARKFPLHTLLSNPTQLLQVWLSYLGDTNSVHKLSLMHTSVRTSTYLISMLPAQVELTSQPIPTELVLFKIFLTVSFLVWTLTALASQLKSGSTALVDTVGYRKRRTWSWGNQNGEGIWQEREEDPAVDSIKTHCMHVYNSQRKKKNDQVLLRPRLLIS